MVDQFKPRVVVVEFKGRDVAAIVDVRGIARDKKVAVNRQRLIGGFQVVD